MDFHLITNNSTGEFVGGVIFLFAALDTLVVVVLDNLRNGSMQGFGEVK